MNIDCPKFVIPAQPGWFVLSLWEDPEELHREPVLAWRVEVETEEDSKGWIDRFTPVWPITVEEPLGKPVLQRPDGSFVDPDNCSWDAGPEGEARVIEFLRADAERTREQRNEKLARYSIAIPPRAP